MPKQKISLDFKLLVVRHALSLPVNARIKPTCREFKGAGIQPVQVRKWTRALEPLLHAECLRAQLSSHAPSPPLLSTSSPDAAVAHS
jgi:hypothetical protein